MLKSNFFILIKRFILPVLKSNRSRGTARSSLKLLFPILLSLIFSSGCAFTDAHVQMTYEPICTAKVNNKDELLIYPIRDSRDEKKIIGFVRNGLGDKTADVVLENGQDVSKWLTTALIEELNQVGFAVKKDVDLTSWEGLTVSGDLNSISFDTSPNFMHNVKIIINLEVKDDNKIILNKTYDGAGQAKAMWGVPSEREIALKSALQSAFGQFLSDLIEHL